MVDICRAVTIVCGANQRRNRELRDGYVIGMSQDTHQLECIAHATSIDYKIPGVMA